MNTYKEFMLFRRRNHVDDGDNDHENGQWKPEPEENKIYRRIVNEYTSSSKNTLIMHGSLDRTRVALGNGFTPIPFFFDT